MMDERFAIEEFPNHYKQYDIRLIGVDIPDLRRYTMLGIRQIATGAAKLLKGMSAFL